MNNEHHPSAHVCAHTVYDFYLWMKENVLKFIALNMIIIIVNTFCIDKNILPVYTLVRSALRSKIENEKKEKT